MDGQEADKQEMNTQEKDILFVNRFEHTREYYNEVYSYSFYRTPAAALRFLILIIGAACMVIGLSILGFLNVLTLIIVFAYVVIGCFILVLRYMKFMNLKYKQGLELSGGEPAWAELTVTDRGIEVFNEGSEKTVSISFERIKSFGKTKNYYILITEAKIYWTFKKDGFVKGRTDDFLSFLRGKGIKC